MPKELAIVKLGSFRISGGGIFDIGVKSEVNSVSVYGYTRLPFISMSYPMNSLKTGSVIGFLPSVLGIFNGRCLPKIINAIIRPIKVFMVNLLGRPRTVNVKPSKASGYKNISVNLNHPSTTFSNRARNTSSGDGKRLANFPSKFPRLLRIVDNLQKIFVGNVFHDEKAYHYG